MNTNTNAPADETEDTLPIAVTVHNWIDIRTPTKLVAHRGDREWRYAVENGRCVLASLARHRGPETLEWTVNPLDENNNVPADVRQAVRDVANDRRSPDNYPNFRFKSISMAELKEYRIEVSYTKYVGGAEPEIETTATLDVWARGESQARRRAKDHVAAVVGEKHVGSTSLIRENGEEDDDG